MAQSKEERHAREEKRTALLHAAWDRRAQRADSLLMAFKEWCEAVRDAEKIEEEYR